MEHSEYKEKVFQNLEIKVEYDALQSEYEDIQTNIDASKTLNSQKELLKKEKNKKI